MLKLGKCFAIATILFLFMSTMAFAGPNRNNDEIQVSVRTAILVGDLIVTGTQSVAVVGDCSFNEYLFSGQITGTSDDGGGMDDVLFEVWDDGELKDSEIVSIPVGETRQITVVLMFEGVYGTGAPGVGLQVIELGYDEDPFYPIEVEGTCPSICTLDLNLSYADGILNLDFDLGSAVPSTWNVWLSFQNEVIPIWSIPIPAIDPPVSFSVPIPGLPPLGVIGFLTTLTVPEGISCSDWGTVYTGSMRSMGAPTTTELEKLFLE